MNTKIALLIIALIALIAISLLLTGCPQHIDSQYGVKVTCDGNGNALAVYEDKLGGSVYIQKISLEGKPLWRENGIRLCDSDPQFYNYHFINLVANDSGGAMITVPAAGYQYTVFNIDAQGQSRTITGFADVEQILSDGEGGVILDITQEGQNTSVVKVDSSGNFPWGVNGISLPKANEKKIESDGSGGAVITWLELRYPPEAKPGEAFSTSCIYAQKISSDGLLKWDEGVPIYTSSGTYAESLQIIGDGTGGAIIAWHQQPMGRIESGSPDGYFGTKNRFHRQCTLAERRVAPRNY